MEALILAHRNEVDCLRDALDRREGEIWRLRTELEKAQSSAGLFPLIERMQQEISPDKDVSNVIMKCARVLVAEVSSRERELERLRSCDLALSSERELSESLAEELRRLKDRLSGSQEENASLRTDLAVSEECSQVVRQSMKQALEEAEALRERLLLTQDQLARARSALKDSRADLELALSCRKPDQNMPPSTPECSALIESLQQELSLVRGDLRALISLGMNVGYESEHEERSLSSEAAMLSVLRMTLNFHSETGRGSALGTIRTLSAQIEHVLQSALLVKARESDGFVSSLVQEMQEIMSISKSSHCNKSPVLNDHKLKADPHSYTETFSTPIRNPFSVDLDDLEGGWGQSGTDTSSFCGRVTDESDMAGLDSWDLPPMTPPPCFD